MLITPEQKRDQTATICDNHKVQQQTDSDGHLCEDKGPLDNSELVKKAERNEEDKSSSDDSSDGNSSLSSSMDISNCNSPRSFSPRTTQRLKAKFPPHINLSNSKQSSQGMPRRALFINDDITSELCQPMSPLSGSPTRAPLFPGPDNDKHEVISGRLHLIRHTGNVSPSQSPSSPSRVQMKCFPFQVKSPAFSSPSSSPPSPSSPTLSSKRKMPVYMRVYKCNLGHFALVSRDSSYSSKHVYLNMRHCRVMPGNCLGRFMIAGHCDSGSLMEFETADLASLEKWLDALQNGSPPGSPIRHANACNSAGSSSCSTGSPSIPKSPALPTLAEIEEEN